MSECDTRLRINFICINRSYTTITLDEETRLYLSLQGHRKAFSNKASIRSLMRKLETRRQKRSKGFNVQLLERQELQRSNIVVSEDGIIKLPFKNTLTRRETIKMEVKPEFKKLLTMRSSLYLHKSKIL